MTRQSFYKLPLKVESDICSDATQASNILLKTGSSNPISCWRFTSCYISAFWSRTRKFFQQRMRQFHIGLNTDEEELKKTAILKHVVKTPKPKKKEVGPSISSCRNRKVPWGIVVSAGVDSDCRFTMMWARNSGGSHDCLVWDSITSSVMKRSLTRTSF